MNDVQRISGEDFVRFMLDGKPSTSLVIPTAPSDTALRVVGAVDLAGRVISGTRIAIGVVFHGPVDFSNSTFNGSLDLSGSIFEEGLRLDDIEINGSLRLANIRVGSSGSGGPTTATTDAINLRIVGAVIEGRLNLLNASVDGSIALFGSRIEGFLDLRGVRSVNISMRGIVVNGDLRMGCAPGGSQALMRVKEIRAPNISVSGSIYLLGIGSFSDDTEMNAPDFLMQRAHVGGSLVIAPFHPDQPEIDHETLYPGNDFAGWWEVAARPSAGLVLLYNATIGADVIMKCGKIDRCWFDAAQIGGRMDIAGMKFVQDASFSLMTCGRVVAIENEQTLRTEFGGQLNLSGLSKTKRLIIRGVSVRRSLLLNSISVREVWIIPGIDVPEESEQKTRTFYPSQAGHIEIRNSVISGNVDLSHVQIFGSRERGSSGITIENTTIKGDLELWNTKRFRHSTNDGWLDDAIRPWDFCAAVAGHINILHTTITGDCVLTFAKVSGFVNLSDSTVGGDFKVASTFTHSALSDTPRMLADMRALDAASLHYRATCVGLAMRMLRCGNDIDLTGLTVFPSLDSSNVKNFKGVSAEYLEVKGDFRTFATDAIAGREVFATIAGKLELGDCTAALVAVSANEFATSTTAANSPSEVRLSLVRGKIDTLEIPKLEKLGYPHPIDLDDASVRVWKIGDNLSAPVNDEEFAARYTDLLAGTDFRRSNYKAIETSLRNSGDEVAADAIYVAMHNAVRTGKRRGIVRSFWKIFLSYGTDATPLIWLIVAVMIQALPIYLNPANFESSLSRLATNPSSYFGNDPLPVHNGSPSRSDWDWEDALAVAVHYHIPVLPVSLRTDWDPKSSRGIAIGGREACAVQEEWLVGLFSSCAAGQHWWDAPIIQFNGAAPEDFVALMQAINWVLWSILLTYLIRKAIRQ